MKVILLKNVPKIGKKDEIKDLPDGYVRNFLLPQKLALIATNEVVKNVERAQNEIRVGREIQSDLFKKNLRSVNGIGLTIYAKANGEGSLYKAVGPKDVAAALKKDHKIVMEENLIHMEPAKHVGTYKASVQALGMKEEIEVTIVGEK